MSTTTILDIFLAQVKTLGIVLGLPVAYPGIPKDPPSSGMWLEVRHFPNEPRDLAWGNTSQMYVMGFFQVSVFYRPGINTGQNSQLDAIGMADQVIAGFAKGQSIGDVRVLKTPSQSQAIDLKGKSFIPVTISYRGIVEAEGYSDALVVGGSSTSDIAGDLLARLSTLSPALPVAWPGIQKKPPSSGMWLEARFIPKESDDLVWGNDTQKNTSGSLMVSVFYRPGINAGQSSQVAASAIADDVIALFPKGLGVGAVRVNKSPWQNPAIDMEGKSYIPVIVPYLGIIQVPDYSDSVFNVTNNGANVTNNGIQVTHTP